MSSFQFPDKGEQSVKVDRLIDHGSRSEQDQWRFQLLYQVEAESLVRFRPVCLIHNHPGKFASNSISKLNRVDRLRVQLALKIRIRFRFRFVRSSRLGFALFGGVCSPGPWKQSFLSSRQRCQDNSGSSFGAARIQRVEEGDNLLYLGTDWALAIVFVCAGAFLEQKPIEVWDSLAKLFPSDVGRFRRILLTSTHKQICSD